MASAALVFGDWVQQWSVRSYNQSELDSQANIAREAAKLTGIEFNGVMCSATAEDMWGLNSIKDWVIAGNSTNFRFENGNVLELTPANYSGFEAVWTPFRASFF